MNTVDIRFKITNFVSKRPNLYLFLMNLLGGVIKPKPGQTRVNKNTKIVIEGYPRAANTFAYHAFTYAQGEDFDTTQIAHHIHKISQVAFAIKHNIPCILLFRNPKDCILSLKIRRKELSIKNALLAYSWFYEAAYDYMDDCVVVHFDRATASFGEVIDEVNKKYNTNFKTFAPSEEDMKKVFYNIEHSDDILKGKVDVKMRTGKPSDLRKEKKKEYTILYEDPQLKPLVERAESIYHKTLAYYKERYNL